jgi:hypothetical protein
MKRSYFATALLSGLLISGAAFAQSSTSTTQPTAAQKQKTDGGGDPTGQYNYATPGGQYSERGATKQKTDGADVTGQYNFPTPGGQYSNRGATKQQ